MYNAYNIYNESSTLAFFKKFDGSEVVLPQFDNDSSIASVVSINGNQNMNYLKSLANLGRIHNYTGETTLKLILEEFDSTDLTLDSSADKLTELADILDFLSHYYGFFGGPYLDYILDEDTNDALFFRVIFLKAGRKEWKEIENSMAKRQVLTKGMLAVFCMKGFE